MFEKISTICLDYCNKNNLKLVIWDNELTKRESIFNQFTICNNAEIIIGFGGSFWLFNYTINTGKILSLGNITEYNEKIKILYDMTFYQYSQHINNKNIDKIFIHFWESSDVLNYDSIVHEFLYNN
jgi:hypothetical protein